MLYSCLLPIPREHDFLVSTPPSIIAKSHYSSFLNPQFVIDAPLRNDLHVKDPLGHVLLVIGSMVTWITFSFSISLMDILVPRLKIGPNTMWMKDLRKKGPLQDEHPT